VQAMSDAARPACILETRKTAPGLRLIDKWPVSIHFFMLLLFISSGCFLSPRIAILFDMVMIKDNHISVAGGIAAMRSIPAEGKTQFLSR
jgi:nicotinate-nucleotide pyrophosphorylase (carboxylating)